MGIEVYEGAGHDPYKRAAPKGPQSRRKKKAEAPPKETDFAPPPKPQQQSTISPSDPRVTRAYELKNCGWLRPRGNWPNLELGGQKVCTMQEMRELKKIYGFTDPAKLLERKSQDLLAKDQNGNAFLVLRPLLVTLSYQEMKGFNAMVEIQFDVKGDEVYLVQ